MAAVAGLEAAGAYIEAAFKTLGLVPGGALGKYRQPFPVMIGGGGEKVTLRIVAQHANIWNGQGEPDVLAQEIADDLQTALEQFQAIAEKLKG